MPFPENQPGHDTLRWRGLWTFVGWLLVAAVILLSLVKLEVSLPHAQADKSGHVLAYAVLMFWFAQLYTTKGNRLAIAGGLLVLGCSLEVVQHVVGRDFEFADMFANALGISLGWLAAPPRTPHALSRIESCVFGRVRP